MSKTRKFRVLKDMMVSMSYPRIISSETILSLTDLGVVNGFNSFWCNEYKFIIRDLKTIISMGYLEEILPDKKPILSDRISTEELANNLKQMNDALNEKSENPYGRKIYLAEVFHALTNHDVLIKDKYGYVWDYDKIDETFYTYDDKKDTIVITDKYTLKEILEFQFDVIPKPVEEVKEKWVEIETHKDLCNAIVNKKMIRLGDGKPSNEYNDKQIETLFEALEHGVFKIEYLEE